MVENKHDSFPFTKILITVIFIVIIILMSFWVFIKNSDINNSLKREVYSYQYVKLKTIKYSPWTSWKKNKEVSCNSKKRLCKKNSLCLKEERIIKKEKKSSNEINQITIQKINTKKIEVCREENYILFNNTLYQTKNDYNNIKNWEYKGRNTYKTPPKDTLNKKYKYAGIKVKNDQEDILYYFDQYWYSSIFLASNKCENPIKKNIHQYSYIAKEINDKKEKVCLQEVRTRKIKKQSDFIWSKKFDQELIKAGYQYTGKKRRS